MSTRIPGTPVTAVINAVNGARDVDVNSAPGAIFWLTGAASLTGLTLVPEISLDGVNWLAGVMYTTVQTAATPIIVSAALAADSTFGWYVPAQGARAVRLRASAILTGSATLRGQATDDPAPVR